MKSSYVSNQSKLASLNVNICFCTQQRHNTDAKTTYLNKNMAKMSCP